MKTFQQFLELAERYYEPDEKLPSGKTPHSKALGSYLKYYDKPESERTLRDATRMNRQITRVNQRVAHGADNPNFNLHRDMSGEVNVRGMKDSHMTIHHPESGVRFSIYNTRRTTGDGKPIHDVMWNHSKDYNSLSDSERRRLIYTAKNIWNNHVSHRLPHGSVLKNYPLPNYDDTTGEPKYARAELYSKIGGFGPRSNITGLQYAGVGREPSPKQREKDRNKKRTYPMNSNTETSSLFGN